MLGNKHSSNLSSIQKMLLFSLCDIRLRLGVYKLFKESSSLSWSGSPWLVNLCSMCCHLPPGSSGFPGGGLMVMVRCKRASGGGPHLLRPTLETGTLSLLHMTTGTLSLLHITLSQSNHMAEFRVNKYGNRCCLLQKQKHMGKRMDTCGVRNGDHQSIQSTQPLKHQVLDGIGFL